MNLSFINNLKNWHIFLILAIIIFSLYGQAVSFGLSYLDDSALILDDFHTISNFSNFFEVFKHDLFYGQRAGAFYYRPMLTVSLMIDAAIGGKDPFIYHLSNILLHLATVYLLFIFLQKLNYSRLSSFLASLLLAIHPISTRIASWVPGRTETILAIFIILSFIYLIDYLKEYKIKDLILHLIFFLLALLQKETAVFVPILFALYLFLERKDLYLACCGFFNKKSLGKPGDDGSQKKQREVFGKLLAMLIGWLAALIFWFVLRSQALGGGGIGMSFVQILRSLIINLPGLFLYIGKVFFPFDLSVYPILQDSSLFYGILATLLIAILILLSRKSLKLNRVIFGSVWFLVLLIPSFLRPNQGGPLDFMEHRIYIPLIGILIIFLEINWDEIFKKRYLKEIVFIFIIALFLFINIFSSRVFLSRITFWENAVKNSPHFPLAHRNLGAMYWLDGRVDEAEKEYLESLRLNPEEPMAHNNLGLIYASRGDFENAIKEYEAELKINPYYGNALYNMGLAYWNTNKKEEAAQKWKEVIIVNPNYFSAYKALIMFYQENGQKDLADELLFELQRRGGL